MLSTLLLPRGFNKVSTRIQEVRVAKGISSKSSALEKASNLIQGQCVNYYMEERIICPALFSTHRSGFPLRLSHRLTGGIVAKVDQQKIFQCWSSTSELPSREESTDQHNLSNYMNRLNERREKYVLYMVSIRIIFSELQFRYLPPFTGNLESHAPMDQTSQLKEFQDPS